MLEGILILFAIFARCAPRDFRSFWPGSLRYTMENMEWVEKRGRRFFSNQVGQAHWPPTIPSSCKLGSFMWGHFISIKYCIWIPIQIPLHHHVWYLWSWLVMSISFQHPRTKNRWGFSKDDHLSEPQSRGSKLCLKLGKWWQVAVELVEHLGSHLSRF